MARLISHLLSIFFAFHLFINIAFAQEFLSGQIIDVDSTKMEIIIRLETEPGHGEQMVVIKPAEKNILPKQGDKTVLPVCVIKGDQIKIWGEWGNDKETEFLAHDIMGCKDGGCADPTGIMTRLKKSSGKYRQQMRRNGSGSRGSNRNLRYRGGH